MPITIICPCGRRLLVNDTHVGQSGKCPVCGRVLKTTICDMLPEPQQCHECRRPAEVGESFHVRRVRRAAGNRKRKETVEIVLCPACEAEHQNVKESGVGKQHCDHCKTRIQPGQAVLRSKTDTEVAGAVAYHRTVHMVLCPACAKQYDDTGRWMLVCMGLFVGLLAFCGLLGMFFR
jgi:hypothetical protein